MKINFKKIASVLATTAMLGSTIAFASAALSLPASDNVVVYGNALDSAAAVDMASVLTGASGATTVTGGDVVTLEKSSQKFWVGKGIGDVFTRAITDSDMSEVLADGIFTNDDNNDYDYTQKINLANRSFSLFDDNDYKTDTPTLGMRIASGAHVLNYTLQFTDVPKFDNTLETSTINMMGKSYYVLDAQNGTTKSLTFLDSAVTDTVSEDAEKVMTVGGKSFKVAIDYIGSTTVKLNVDGKTTNSLSAGSTYKVADNTYIGVKDILYNSKEAKSSSVELSLGLGKLKLTDGSEVELNDDSVSGLTAWVSNDSSVSLTKIILEWRADGDQFVTSDSSVEMPGFKIVKLSSDGVVFPKEETTEIVNNGKYRIDLQTTIKDGSVTLPILSINETDGNYTWYGEAKDKQLRINSSATGFTFDGDTDANFIASYKSGTDAESYILKATSFTSDSGVNKTTLKKEVGTWSKDVKEGDTVTLGNVELTVGIINKDGKDVALTSSTATFDRLYTAEGLQIVLPLVNSSTPKVEPTLSIRLAEEDKDGNIGSGSAIVVNVSRTTTDNYAYVKTVTGAGDTLAEIGSTSVNQGYVYSALATQILHDTNPDQDTVKLVYHGAESYGKFYVSTPEAVTTSTGTVAPVMASALTDADKAKNLIVVGGSCVNTVAAKLITGLETPVCGAAFSAKTNVGAGQYMIKGFTSPYASDKIAVLVAGYEQAQTLDAVKATKALGSLTKTTNVVGPTLA